MSSRPASHHGIRADLELEDTSASVSQTLRLKLSFNSSIKYVMIISSEESLLCKFHLKALTKSNSQKEDEEEKGGIGIAFLPLRHRANTSTCLSH